MSDAVTALGGATYDGTCQVEEVWLTGMITLRADLGSADLKKACMRIVGCDVPRARGVDSNGDYTVLWMSPDELLIVVPYEDVGDVTERLRKALSGMHHLVENVSDARSVFRVSGSAARDVMAKLTPADLRPGSFIPGELRRTRLAQVPAAFWMRDTETFEIICFRSVAEYVFDILALSARTGSEVGYYR
jgi:sarcosine oxidase subunit gamma